MGRFGQMHDCGPANYGPINFFFDQFEFKMPNNFGPFVCKKLLWTKIGLVIFGLSAHSHRPNFFMKYFNFVL